MVFWRMPVTSDNSDWVTRNSPSLRDNVILIIYSAPLFDFTTNWQNCQGFVENQQLLMKKTKEQRFTYVGVIVIVKVENPKEKHRL